MVNGNPTGWEKAADVNAKHNQTTTPIPKVEPMQIVYFTHKANETAEEDSLIFCHGQFVALSNELYHKHSDIITILLSPILSLCLRERRAVGEQ